MYFKPIFKETINNKQMYSPRLYNYTEIPFYCIYLQYTPSVRYYLHTVFWYRHTYMTFPPSRLQRLLYGIYTVILYS